MKTKLSVVLAVFTLLIFASPAFAQKHGKGGGKGNKGNKDGQHYQDSKSDRHGSDNQNQGAKRHHDNDYHHHSHHWGGGPGWNWYAGTGGFGFYYGPRYSSCHNYYYPVAPWRPVVYHPWTHYYYFYGADPCPIHGIIHEGYCQYYYDDDGGMTLFFWYP